MITVQGDRLVDVEWDFVSEPVEAPPTFADLSLHPPPPPLGLLVKAAKDAHDMERAMRQVHDVIRDAADRLGAFYANLRREDHA